MLLAEKQKHLESLDQRAKHKKANSHNNHMNFQSTALKSDNRPNNGPYVPDIESDGDKENMITLDQQVDTFQSSDEDEVSNLSSDLDEDSESIDT
eukprot:UN27164